MEFTYGRTARIRGGRLLCVLPNAVVIQKKISSGFNALRITNINGLSCFPEIILELKLEPTFG
jgi:hypothetical protein